jgi:hypothetical protein
LARNTAFALRIAAGTGVAGVSGGVCARHNAGVRRRRAAVNRMREQQSDATERVAM